MQIGQHLPTFLLFQKLFGFFFAIVISRVRDLQTKNDLEWLRMTFNDLEWPKMTKIDLKWLKTLMTKNDLT